MNPRAVIMAAGGLILLALAAEPASAQANPAQQDTVRLVLEREVFSYPTFQRRNPFRPLTGRDEGPRFEDLVLLGVIQTADPGSSVALLGVRGGGDGGQTYRVRVGERLGNSRIVEIRRQEVVASVEEFGVSENRILRLRRTEPQPGAPSDDEGTQPAGSEDTNADPPSSGDPDTGDDAGDYANGGSS
jgi:hypothetical protein